LAFSQRVTDLGVSLALHAAIGLLIFLFARSKVLTQVVEEVFVDMEIWEEESEPKPEPKPEPKQTPLEKVPVAQRPEKVPDAVKVTKTKRSRAFQTQPIKADRPSEAPDDAEAIEAPTTTLSFAMTETVGGQSGLEYSSTTAGTMALPPPGPAGGAPGKVNTPGATNVEVAQDWQITRLAEPLNDSSFEPTYPPLAKRQGREAVVVVRLDIDRSGKVVQALAVEGPTKHGFREAAVAYTQKLTFQPAMAGTNPVASRIEWTVHFYVRN
jgi:protein TonB